MLLQRTTEVIHISLIVRNTSAQEGVKELLRFGVGVGMEISSHDTRYPLSETASLHEVDGIG